MLDGSVLAASIMAVNNEVGTIQDLPEIAGLLARYGVTFHCDAAQAPCAMDVSRHWQNMLTSLACRDTRFTGRRALGRCTSEGTSKLKSNLSYTAVGSRTACAPAPFLYHCAWEWLPPQKL